MGTFTDQPADQLAPPAELEFHPAADLFPLLPVDSPEFGQLVHDLQEHGLVHPIVLHEGRILDGRNRCRACRHAGVEPRFVEWSGESPTAYVLSLNLHRRHLTDGQRAMIAVKALPLFEAEAQERRRELGRKAAERQHDPGRVEANLPQPSPRAPQARDRAGALLGVSGRTVQTARAISEQAPDLAEQLDAGAMSVHQAEREMARRRASTVRPPGDVQRDRQAGDDEEPNVVDGEDPAEATAPIDLPPVITPVGRWTAEELEARALLEQGMAVAVNLRSHRNLIAWAQHNGLFVRVDRATPWGNPFELGKDGDRPTVIANYRDHYLPFKPSLTERFSELRGKALGCWCAPEPCHADVLIRELERDER